MTIQNNIQNIKAEFKTKVKSVQGVERVEQLRVEYMGRKGLVAGLFKSLGQMSPDERRNAGKMLNDLKNDIQEDLDMLFDKFASSSKKQNNLDISLPGDHLSVGRYHPLTTILREIKSIFASMGFVIAQGPEVETEYYNFEALNIPKGHPARDMQDTLFLSEDVVLRTHTSPVQIRVMENQQPPVRVIAPGRCYRRDTPDATHSPVFHQVEGLCVDQGISFADLKGVILNFARRLLGSDMKIRFRPSFFPFTEPSAEYDFSCLICKGKGCRVCKDTGWIEISGAGMVNPAVFEYVGYDPEKYTGFAFGMGVERIAMLVYEIHDIRMFYENDVRFLNQF